MRLCVSFGANVTVSEMAYARWVSGIPCVRIYPNVHVNAGLSLRAGTAWSR